MNNIKLKYFDDLEIQKINEAMLILENYPDYFEENIFVAKKLCEEQFEFDIVLTSILKNIRFTCGENFSIGR